MNTGMRSKVTAASKGGHIPTDVSKMGKSPAWCLEKYTAYKELHLISLSVPNSF